jgi:ABC-type polysaccharide transport system permease subunit
VEFLHNYAACNVLKFLIFFSIHLHYLLRNVNNQTFSSCKKRFYFSIFPDFLSFKIVIRLTTVIKSGSAEGRIRYRSQLKFLSRNAFLNNFHFLEVYVYSKHLNCRKTIRVSDVNYLCFREQLGWAI